MQQDIAQSNSLAGQGDGACYVAVTHKRDGHDVCAVLQIMDGEIACRVCDGTADRNGLALVCYTHVGIVYRLSGGLIQHTTGDTILCQCPQTNDQKCY